MYGEAPFVGSELAFVAAADADPETGVLGGFARWVTGADKKAARARKALAAARAAEQEAQAAAAETDKIRRESMARRDRAKADLVPMSPPASPAATIVSSMRGPSALVPVVPTWALVLGAGLAAWSIVPGRLALPAALGAVVGVGAIEVAKKRSAETGACCAECAR